MEIATSQEFGVEARNRRLELGLTQSQVANKAGVSRQWVSDIERGKPGAELHKVLDLVWALDLSLTVTPQGSPN